MKFENFAELSFAEKLTTLESSRLGSDKKLDLALLILGRKKAAQLGSFKILEGESKSVQAGVIQQFTTEFADIKKVLDELGLKYHEKNVPENREGIFGFSLLVAQDESVLSHVVDADRGNDDKAFGTLMGYPASAIETYNTKEAFDFDQELPPEELKNIEEEHLRPFLFFMPSRAHWKEELNKVREDRDLIKEHAPKLYAELTK